MVIFAPLVDQLVLKGKNWFKTMFIKKDILMVRARNTGANMMTPRTTSMPEVEILVLI